MDLQKYIDVNTSGQPNKLGDHTEKIGQPLNTKFN